MHYRTIDHSVNREKRKWICFLPWSFCNAVFTFKRFALLWILYNKVLWYISIVQVQFLWQYFNTLVARTQESNPSKSYNMSKFLNWNKFSSTLRKRKWQNLSNSIIQPLTVFHYLSLLYIVPPSPLNKSTFVKICQTNRKKKLNQTAKIVKMGFI